MRLCQVGDRTVTQVAVELDLTETALRDARAAEPPVVSDLTNDEREELLRLRRDSKRLQME